MLEIEREQCRRWRWSAGIDIVQDEVAAGQLERCARACKSIARLLTYLCSSKMYNASMLAIVLMYPDSIELEPVKCNCNVHVCSGSIFLHHHHIIPLDGSCGHFTFTCSRLSTGFLHSILHHFPYTYTQTQNHPAILRTETRQAWRQIAHAWTRRAQHRLPGTR